MLQQAAAATVGCLLLAACASGASVKVDSIIKQGQMCAATTAEGLDELRLHVNEPQLKVFPCAAGPRAAVHLGQSRDLAVLHHVGNAEDQPQWLSALDGVAGIQVMIASADAAVVQVASNAFDLSALPRLTKYAPLHDAPIKSVDASNSARLAAIRSKAADANDPIIAVCHRACRWLRGEGAQAPGQGCLALGSWAHVHGQEGPASLIPPPTHTHTHTHTPPPPPPPPPGHTQPHHSRRHA